MRSKSKCLFILVLVSVFTLYTSLTVSAGTTGKIKGRVIDAETGDPLPGANVFLEGTMMGAASDFEGHYVILNVKPGNYTLRATMMGYTPFRVENVRVNVDLTTEINFNLSSTVIQSGETVTIVAERPMVVRDLTATTAVVDADQIEALPVTEVTEAIELQAGLVRDAGGGLHVRGGRSGEISYWIDGVPVTDVYDGGTVVDVNKDMVQELQVVSGAFNAEYGQAMSGIVNITTKEGDNKFGGSFTTYAGDYISNHDDVFLNIKDFNPVAIRNIEGSLHGALIKDKLFFYVNARHINFDGWLYGQRRFNPNAVTFNASGVPTEFLRDVAPEYLDDSRVIDEENDLRAFTYVLGTNATIDSIITYDNLPETIRANPDSFQVYFDRVRAIHQNGKGDGKYVPMNWNRKIYAQGKLIYRITPTLKLSYNYILDDVDYQEWSGIENERDYIFNPDGAAKKFRLGQTHLWQMTHVFSAKSFYNIGVSYFAKGFQRYLYEDINDSRYVHPDFALQDPYSFKTAGTNNGRFERETKTWLIKADLTSQITKTHQIKTGIEFRRHDIFQRDFTLRPIESQTQIDMVFDSPYIDTRVLPDSTIYASQYRHKPLEMSAYLQDKMEFKNMVVNLGLRVDYFEPDGVILNDESDPTITNPIRPENRYRDYGTDGIADTHDPDGSEGNGIWDQGEPAVTLAERQTYWYKDAEPKLLVSPRVGVSFPITERGIIHFSYGHFFQIPRFERLYQNPDFELGEGTGNVGVIGNANLKPEHTISGEIGLQQQLSDDISMSLTGYFRDIRDLAGTRAEEIQIFGGSARYSKLINSDFGFVRGIILALNKRFSEGWSASLDYTFQIAKGSNSDPEAARNALEGGSLPEVQLTPLDWDQTHTVNGSFSYGGSSWGTSIIAQWGSGFPYTPRASADITSLLNNSQLKPSTYNVDMRAFKDFHFGPGKATFFIRVFNLFDTQNEINVYDTTGRAGFTTEEQIARATNPQEIVNTLDMWFNNARHYSEPRRVEIGMTYSF